MAADRDESRALCPCIGDAANSTLTQSQMREGAGWFDDPQRAQDTWQSDRAGDEVMWQARALSPWAAEPSVKLGPAMARFFDLRKA